MLFVSRKAGEHIIIQTPSGDEITLRVHRIKGKHVTLGVDADDGYHILREELLLYADMTESA